MCNVCITVQISHQLGHARNNIGLYKSPFSTLDDLDFADDLALLYMSHKHQHIQEKTNMLKHTDNII